MSNTDKSRWQQRLENFCRALAQIDKACDQEDYSDLERAGLVQMFEFSCELSWKALKDLLFYEGYEVKSPREVIRKSFETEYMNEDDSEVFLDALDKRNLLSHTYEGETALEAERLIKGRFCPPLRRMCNAMEAKRGS